MDARICLGASLHCDEQRLKFRFVFRIFKWPKGLLFVMILLALFPAGSAYFSSFLCIKSLYFRLVVRRNNPSSWSMTFVTLSPGYERI